MRAVIFAGGDLGESHAVKELLEPYDYVIAADGGLRHCTTLGLQPHVLLGDFDSVTEQQFKAAEKAGIKIQRYNPEKDETDLELALLHAAARPDLTEVLVFGALGSRWDQSIASLMLPLHPKIRRLAVTFYQNGQRLFIVDDVRLFDGKPGTLVSIIPVGGDAIAVRTRYLQYPLIYEHLFLGETRGVSNVMLGNKAEVSVQRGFVMVIVGGVNPAPGY